MISMFKFELNDCVKIPFNGRLVDGRVKECRVYYNKKEKKAYNQYSVKIRGAKHFKKIFEDDLMKNNPNGGIQKPFEIVIEKKEIGPGFADLRISGDIDFEDFVYIIKSNYLFFDIKVK